MNEVERLQRQRWNESRIAECVLGQPPDALYDIGVGPKTEWMTLRGIFPRIKLFGVEPHPNTFAELMENKFDGMLLPNAISQNRGTVDLHLHDTSPMQSSLFPVEGASKSISIEAITLDEFDALAGKQSRVILWIDVEGSEVDVLLSGAALMSSGRVRWINVEEHLESPKLQLTGWCDSKSLHMCLEKFGYRRHHEYANHGTHRDVIYVHLDEKTKRPARR